MSPIEPLSPLSPMDISPLSPLSPGLLSEGEWPATPVITPSAHLPRLVTSFQSGVVDSFRRLSSQFQLPTPSPLSLRKTPVTALPRSPAPMQMKESRHSRPGFNSVTSRSASLSSLNAALQDFAHEDLPLISPVVEREHSCLRRQNAMQGLDEMMAQLSSPIIEQVVALPPRRARAARISPLSPVDCMQASSANSPRTNRTNRRARVQPRSPINKHKRHRHRKSMDMIATPSAKLYNRKALTQKQEEYHKRVAHLSNELQPLISVRTGQPHPEFPHSLLQYHLLTHAQLDSLARWYHQTIDAGNERWMYPAPIGFGKAWCAIPASSQGDASKREVVDLLTKRRRWGRFIGLKGCESPVAAPQESLTDKMECEWREALKKSEDELRMREKLWGRKFG